MKMLSHDIADRKFLEIIEKFLKAGIMENENFWTANGEPHRKRSQSGTCKCLSALLLDNWFDVIVKRQCKGECYLIRYCDDFVCCFQNEYEARVFRQRLEERFRNMDWNWREKRRRF